MGTLVTCPASGIDWPQRGVAIEGDFAGIQRFVLRPIPGAGGAARRLRARSFRVLALTRLAADAVRERFRDAGARLFYSAGGRFLIVLEPSPGWQQAVAALQTAMDDDLLDSYHGELAFHIAGAEYTDGRIPVAELARAMSLRKGTPLGGALQAPNGWIEASFMAQPIMPGKCAGCGETAEISDHGDQLCQGCLDDQRIGAHLLGDSPVALVESVAGAISFLGKRWGMAPSGALPVPLVRHAPAAGKGLATFEELARRSAGRSYLGYAHIDADQIGAAFRNLGGDPGGTRALSRLLDEAFSSGVSNLLRSRFPNLYPVYGGGDDLFVIGPWNDVFEFTEAWRAVFRELTDDRLTFSAGVVLARSREHILTKSEEAVLALERAKVPRDSIHALGATIPFSTYGEVLVCARQVAGLHSAGNLRSAMLHNVIELHNRAQPAIGVPNGDPRWRALLHYQVGRNAVDDVGRILREAFLDPGRLWQYAGFIARYAMLTTGGREDG